jgi:hypothetical protein
MTHDEKYLATIEAYHIFTTPEGKLVLEDLEKSNFIYQSTHVPGDPHGTAINEGRRVAILGIQRMLEAAHDPALKDNLNRYFVETDEVTQERWSSHA